MKCTISEQLDSYIQDRLSPLESQKFEKHVEQCVYCQNQLAGIYETLPVLDIQLEEAPLLSEAFTKGILHQLNDKRRMRATRKIRWGTVWKAVAVSFIGFLLVLSLSAFLSPTLANYVKSFFMTTRGDQGLKHAAEMGMSTPHDVRIVDQGITLHIQEVLADTERVAVVCDVLDANGQSLVGRDDVDLIKGIKLTDVTGQTEIGSWTYKMIQERALLESEIGNLLFQGKLPDEVVIDINYTELGGIKGNWKKQIPVHLTKAKAASKTVKIEQRYTSPQGYVIGLQRVELAPSGVGVVLETNEENVLQGEPPMYNFAYRLLDDQGRTLRVHEEFIEEEGYKSEQLTLMGPVTQPGSAPGWKVWSDLFAPLKENSTSKLTFKLDAIYVQEKVNASKEITPKQLKEQPVALESKGNRITLSHFRIKQDKAEEMFLGQPVPKNGAMMEFEGTLAQHVIAIGDIRVTDDKGGMLPSGFSIHERWKDSEGLVHIRGLLSIPDMVEEPNRLTIGFHQLNKKNVDVDWEVPILLNPN
ncbi:DUF4179 domain-containing protein [Paenibacillus sp. RC67]|uniref:DUF4179 domain-containing protein n=1 Tax=Paenibacillus sp. RC67 TaxID=3039392 RepID=UPI0024ADFD61|nr:DUF4179 domain-containing protein [Paenibacillus sp. RC67]